VRQRGVANSRVLVKRDLGKSKRCICGGEKYKEWRRRRLGGHLVLRKGEGKKPGGVTSEEGDGA